MLIQTLLLLAPCPADDAWIERLDFPALSQRQINLVVRDGDLGIPGAVSELGFPADPQERVRDAFVRAEAGQRDALTLHQAVSGLVALRDFDNFKQVMPACLNTYMQELQAAPDDAELRLRFAKALALAGTFVRDDRFFRDAGVQLAKVAQALPGDWIPLDEQARVLVARAVFCQTGNPDPLWLARAVELSEEAIALAPMQVAPRWRRFYAGYTASASSGEVSKEVFFGLLAEMADELAASGLEIEEPRLALAGEAYWFLANLAPISDSDWAASGETEEIDERLAAFRETLRSTDASELRTGAARAWWGLGAFMGDAASWQDDMELAIEMGVSMTEAHILALVGFHKRGLADEAREIAEVLAEADEGDEAWRALTVYRHETGDQAGALEAQAQVAQVDPTLRLARAQLRLHTGDLEAARDELDELVGEVTGSDLAGPVGHAYGVALALTGDVPGARLQLSIAARLMGDEAGEGARATLEELE